MKKILNLVLIIFMITFVLSCSSQQTPQSNEQTIQSSSIIGKWEFFGVNNEEKFNECRDFRELCFDWGSIIEFYKDGTFVNWYIRGYRQSQLNGKYILIDNKTIRFEIQILGTNLSYVFEYELKGDLLILKTIHGVKVVIGLIPYKELPLTYENIEGLWECYLFYRDGPFYYKSDPYSFGPVGNAFYIEFDTTNKKCYSKTYDGFLLYIGSFVILNNNQISIIGEGGSLKDYNKYIVNIKLTKVRLEINDSIYLKRYLLNNY